MVQSSRQRLCLATVLVLALVSGCRCGQGRAAPDAGTPSPVEAREARAEDEVHSVYSTQPAQPAPLAQRLCAALHEVPARRRAECCGGAPMLLVEGECVRTLSAALASKAVKLEPSAVEACAQAMEKSHAGCEWVGPEALPVPASCLGLLEGTLAAGARCRSSLECMEGLRCHGVGPTDMGVCGAASEVGQPCAFSVDSLSTYTRQVTLEELHPECQGHCFKRRCVANVAAGGACLLPEQCGPGHHCAGGQCAEGAVAQLGQPCVSGACEEGARCIQGTCATPKPPGAACERDGECLGGCVRPDGGRQGTCGPRCEAP
jgi:hypothetical protein